ncbi:MAG: lysine-2,3-aminomutase-like protein [Gammaproteobacteria bacterium]|nr:MAG: lysine-2,3-aminomutase-like protein [Gammaproteobacteria bacterium]
MNKSIRTLEALIQHELVNADHIVEIEQVIEHFSLSISPQMQQKIDKTKPDDPIAKQFVPHIEELKTTAFEYHDPIGDDVHTAVKGIIHRYPDRCLLTPVLVCPVYCRFCFRREKIAASSEKLTAVELDNAFTYINHHPEIWEVILTGGDPFILKPAALKKILDRLNAIPHVEVIRFHTRVPVVESAKINADMIAALKCDKPIYVVLHANHPNEFTPEASQACAALVDAGIPMLSQTVLLKDLNDNIETLSTLMRCFIKHRIKPYYLHHADLVRGTQHFRTSIETGQQLMKQLRGRFSGLCQPTYVLDIPGGFGKMPIGPCYLQAGEKANEIAYHIEDYHGDIHAYPSRLIDKTTG